MTSPEATAAQQVAIADRLVRVETKLDFLRESKETVHAEIVKDLADHEARIRTLERVWWRAAGAAGIVAAVTATGMSIAVKFIQ